MAGIVVVYLSKFGARLYAHERATLFDVAAMIARLEGRKMAGSYDPLRLVLCRAGHS